MEWTFEWAPLASLGALTRLLRTPVIQCDLHISHMMSSHNSLSSIMFNGVGIFYVNPTAHTSHVVWNPLVALLSKFIPCKFYIYVPVKWPHSTFTFLVCDLFSYSLPIPYFIKRMLQFRINAPPAFSYNTYPSFGGVPPPPQQKKVVKTGVKWLKYRTSRLFLWVPWTLLSVSSCKEWLFGKIRVRSHLLK